MSHKNTDSRRPKKQQKGDGQTEVKCQYQHPSSPEAHHTESAFKHEALKVSGGLLLFQSFGAVDAVRLFGLAFRVVHPLHVFP